MRDDADSFETFTGMLRTYLMLPAIQPINPADDLLELGLDSFSAIEILVQLEEAFGVRLPDHEITLETFSTVGSLWSVLTRSEYRELADPAPGKSDAAIN